jgi:adenosylmethionine-8-amino-7-oxononanoate aminotransferase
MEKGCMIYPTNGVVNGVRGEHFLIAPPLVISEDQIETAFKILDEAFFEFEKEVQ